MSDVRAFFCQIDLDPLPPPPPDENSLIRSCISPEPFQRFSLKFTEMFLSMRHDSANNVHACHLHLISIHVGYICIRLASTSIIVALDQHGHACYSCTRPCHVCNN